MQAKLVNPLNMQLSRCLLGIFGTFLLMGLGKSSDPCPPPSKLHPCLCSDFPLYPTGSTEDPTASTTESWPITSTESTSTSWFTATSESTSTSWDTTAPQSSSSPWTSTTPQSTSPPWTSTTSRSTSTQQSAAEEATKKKKKHKRSRIQDTNTSQAMGAYYTVITCNDTSDHDLERAIGKTEKRHIDIVHIDNYNPSDENTATGLPYRLFRDIRVKHIKITNTFLRGDFVALDSPFDGQAHSLRWLSVNNCSLRGQLTHADPGTFQTNRFRDLLNLQGINCSYNGIEHIRNSAFNPPPRNLTTLDLSHNRIASMESWALAKLDKLRWLSFRHNGLGTIPQTALPRKSLEHLDFSYNKLNNLIGRLFSEMKTLKTLDLRCNYITAIDSTTYSVPLQRLDILDIRCNYIPCDCGLMWLAEMKTSPNYGKNGSTVAPHPRGTILGHCYYFLPDEPSKHFELETLEKNQLNC